MTTLARSISHTKADSSAPSLAARAGAFAFGLIAYASFFATICYAIGFVGNWIVPKSIDSGTARAIAPSLLINAALLMAFVAQHTIMARPGFKRWWTKIVPRSIERSIFVLSASSILMAIFWLWQPVPTIVWQASHPAAVWGLSALSLLGWGIVFYASFLINHFDLFGLRQVWFALRAKAYAPVGFRLRGIYKLVRHPLMLGFLIAFWATPVMTIGHLFFALLTTGYIFFGTHVEEHDLIAEHGERYLAYKRSVRGLLPIPRRTPQPSSRPVR